MSKLSNIVGRSDYISNPDRQENIVATKTYANWKEYQEYERTHQKTNKANNEGRELIIALPNEWEHLSELELVSRMNELAQKILPKKYEYQWAVHWNKSHTNLHVHLIFSERNRKYEHHEVWDRDIYLTKDGKVARRKSDRAVDKNGNIKPPIHRKGELKDNGKPQFTAKDTRYKSYKWLEQVKDDVIEFYKRFDVSIDEQGILHQYHEGKGSESAIIHEKNKRICQVNAFLQCVKDMGFVLPSAPTEEYKAMIHTIIQPDFQFDLKSISHFLQNRPPLFKIKVKNKETYDLIRSLLDKSEISYLSNLNDNNAYGFLFNNSDKEKIEKIIQQATHQINTSQIDKIISLKHDYVKQCCILHYLKSHQTSNNAQNKYNIAKKAVREFKLQEVFLINANDEYQRTFNPFKKVRLRKELEETTSKFKKSVNNLEKAFSLSLNYDVKTFDSEKMDEILSIIATPLAKMEKKSKEEKEHNKQLEELKTKNITETSVENALRAFQRACDNISEQIRRELYTALKNAPTPRLELEQGTTSKGYSISSENISKVLEKLVPTIQEHKLKKKQEEVKTSRFSLSDLKNPKYAPRSSLTPSEQQANRKRGHSR